MWARKKSSRFFNDKFTMNLTILALLLMTRKLTLVVNFDKKYVPQFLKLAPYFKCECGTLEEYQAGNPEERGSSPSCAICFLQALRVKSKITLAGCFREALRHICVTAGA